jgi:hypothetical protein
MGPLVGVLIAVLVISIRPVPGTAHSVGSDDGLVYHASVPPAAMKRTPAWANGQVPPLSPLKAMLRADAKRAELVRDSADYKWELEKAALHPALGGDRWYYEITYFAQFQGVASTGHPPALRLIVLMDGTVPNPVAWKRADWMRAMSAGAFDPRRGR